MSWIPRAIETVAVVVASIVLVEKGLAQSRSARDFEARTKSLKAALSVPLTVTHSPLITESNRLLTCSPELHGQPGVRLTQTVVVISKPELENDTKFASEWVEKILPLSRRRTEMWLVSASEAALLPSVSSPGVSHCFIKKPSEFVDRTGIDSVPMVLLARGTDIVLMVAASNDPQAQERFGRYVENPDLPLPLRPLIADKLGKPLWSPPKQ